MPLSHDQLITLSTDGYFGNVGKRDIEAVMQAFADTATMTVVGQAIHYPSKAAIRAHFVDFLNTYSRIDVTVLHAMADEQAQRAAVHFEIKLVTNAKPLQTMRNANHFKMNGDGKIEQVHIFMTGTPGDGFSAGNAA